MADLSVNIGDLKLCNPVMTASGTFGYGKEFEDFVDLEKIGGIILKGTTLHHRDAEKISRKHEERCAGRVTYFQFISCCNKFGTVPKAGGWFYRRAICKSCNHERQPPDQIVNLVVLFHVSYFVSH